jgi:hypothetical protein
LAEWLSAFLFLGRVKECWCLHSCLWFLVGFTLELIQWESLRLGLGKAFRLRSLHESGFAVRSDANAAPGLDESVQIIFRNSNRASEPSGCERTAINEPVDGITAKLKSVSDLSNG